ncbi:30S ribosomal protein S7 [Candidatus Peregrinibacteria bacterium]|jgi:small subunit ribosomal protein S7|nr:30S ribosomal protein S7 [Candidatus Peregrinibacteria bacterium]MBT4148476.1 30S ribosomal protein S7 [Candidatus Peregrinibacteria bacterium]
MKKGVTFIPEGSNEVHEKFINYIMKDGKKNTARRIFNDSLKIIAKKTNADPEKVFKQAIDKIKPQLEVKPKRIGGAVYQIPLEVKASRQFTLACRWLLTGTRGKKGTGMAQRLANELIEASNEQGAAYKKKMDTEKMAAANKAFAHFAKY